MQAWISIKLILEKILEHMSMSIEHNDHKNCYENIVEYINQKPMLRRKELSDEEYERCIKNDEIWEIRWYPITPISFHFVCAPTWEECIKKIVSNDWD